MDNLISLVNKIQRACTALGDHGDAGALPTLWDSLPAIAVVGGQSSGKSSVLESIVGKDFLPRGSGIVTRRPLVLQLQKIDDGTREYAEFLHLPRKRFTDFAAVRKEIQDETDRENGRSKAISSVPIHLSIYSPQVVNLTLIDLPGLTKVAVEGQSENIVKDIENMVRSYIEKPNCLILAISPANQDLATSDAIKISREVDPSGERTFGVLTKIDLMDKGTDAVEILEGRSFKLKYPWVGVVNRSQQDINKNVDMIAARKREREYFSNTTEYRHLAHKMGSEHLAKMLSKHLEHVIKSRIPGIRLEDDRKEFFSGQRDYWRQVAQSDGFDIDNVSVPRGTTGLWPVDCQSRRYRQMCCLPKLYAMVGLHRYNMLEGTNFQLNALLKYNNTMNCVRSFFLTSVAVDRSSQLQKTFQVRADEKSYGRLDLTVSIARPKDEKEVTTKKRFIPHFHGEAAADDFYKGELPDWPSVDDLNNQKRFYLVNESELQANDWIHMYLELAVCAREQKTRERDLSKLKILKVAIETKEEDVQPPNGRLKAKSSYVYITFKGLAEAPIGDEFGEHVERKAIVRKVFDERTGYLTLLGEFSTGEKALNTEQPVRREEALDNEKSSGKRPRLD